MELVYNDGQGKSQAVVYEGASADGKCHTLRTINGPKLVIHDSNL